MSPRDIRKHLRLRDFDYASPGAYFVTICTHRRQLLFGAMRGESVRLSPIGEIVTHEWTRTPKVRRNVDLDAFVVMPNHVHAILVLADGIGATRRVAPTSRPRGAVTGSLGAIIGQYKSVASRRINAMRGTPGRPVWQRGYYEHVIRDAAEVYRIRAYIVNNPLRWAFDRENPAAAGEYALTRPLSVSWCGAQARSTCAAVREDVEQIERQMPEEPQRQRAQRPPQQSKHDKRQRDLGPVQRSPHDDRIARIMRRPARHAAGEGVTEPVKRITQAVPAHGTRVVIEVDGGGADDEHKRRAWPPAGNRGEGGRTREVIDQMHVRVYGNTPRAPAGSRRVIINQRRLPTYDGRHGLTSPHAAARRPNG